MTDPNAQKRTREVIGARLRFEILRRCNFACYYCGIPASLGLKQLHVDHVIPIAHGGTNDPWNLVAACWDCNAGKADGVPTPELIRAVRQDEADHQAAIGLPVHPCRFCAVPIQTAPEDDYSNHCGLCDAIMFYGYDAGAGEPHKWVAP